MDDVQMQILQAVQRAPGAARNPMAYVREAVRGFALDVLKNDIEKCQFCKHKCQTKTLPTGSDDAPLMCIMDYPTEKQAKLNKPSGIFEGDDDARMLLEHCFENTGVNMEEILFMNTVSCCPSRAVAVQGGTEEVYRTPFQKEIQACSTFVKYAIQIVYPPMLLIMGNVASNVFLKEPISKARGRWIDYYGIKAKITYSPHEVLDARGQLSNEQWAEMGRQFRQDIEDTITCYRRNWPNSILFH